MILPDNLVAWKSSRMDKIRVARTWVTQFISCLLLQLYTQFEGKNQPNLQASSLGEDTVKSTTEDIRAALSSLRQVQKTVKNINMLGCMDWQTPLSCFFK